MLAGDVWKINHPFYFTVVLTVHRFKIDTVVFICSESINIFNFSGLYINVPTVTKTNAKMLSVQVPYKFGLRLKKS